MVNDESNSWPFNLDQIEDRTRKNYYSLLPDEAFIGKYFRGAFIINKPVNGVGGDGYWFHHNEDFVFLSVFDCVGKGHLASMMTRIYADALKKLVVETSIQFPGSVVQFLHREIKTKFSDKKKIQLNTGADLGILRVNLKTKELEYAGAQMDLIEVRDGRVNVIKGDKLKIGEHFEDKHEYNSTTIKVSKTSQFYIFTDGVVDMIGGPSYQKFGDDNLHALLLEIQEDHMNEQKAKIKQRLKEWAGAQPQFDDILMIGFSFL